MLRPDRFVVDATETARKEGWRPKGVAEWHGDVFSRHGSLLVVYVFVAVDESGERVASGRDLSSMQRKQQGRRGGGRRVQLPGFSMILHSSSRH